ncbi:MAG: hypothetical protein DHS80DRAFT_28400 [Piptocephalis tieghemiana]|nr:MAG: hypothetical protein DHS80DRAFT_28400 [Piptocephalis tieghemiana]
MTAQNASSAALVTASLTMICTGPLTEYTGYKKLSINNLLITVHVLGQNTQCPLIPVTPLSTIPIFINVTIAKEEKPPSHLEVLHPRITPDPLHGTPSGSSGL